MSVQQNETGKNLFCHQKRWNNPPATPGYGPEDGDDDHYDDDDDGGIDNDDKFIELDTLPRRHSKSSWLRPARPDIFYNPWTC